MATNQKKSAPKPKIYTNTRLAPGAQPVLSKHAALIWTFSTACLAVVVMLLWLIVASMRDPSFGSEDNLGVALTLGLLFSFVAVPFTLLSGIVLVIQRKRSSPAENKYLLWITGCTGLIIITCLLIAKYA